MLNEWYVSNNNKRNVVSTCAWDQVHVYSNTFEIMEFKAFQGCFTEESKAILSIKKRTY